MPNKMLIDATHPEETRVVVVRGNRVEEFDFETAQRKQLRGNIYLAKVTRVEPSLQAAFIEYGGNRHGFLAFSEIHPDYYQIPVADRLALIEADEAAHREAEEENENRSNRRRPRHRNARRRNHGERVQSDVVEAAATDPSQAGQPSEHEAGETVHAGTQDASAQVHAEAPADAGTEHHDHDGHEHSHEAVEANAAGETSAEHQDVIANAVAPQLDVLTEAVASPVAEAIEAHGTEAQAQAPAPASHDHDGHDHDSHDHDDHHAEHALLSAAHAEDAPRDDHAVAAESGSHGDDHHDDDEEDDEDEEEAEEDIVESVGGDDVLEEVPERSFRPRRQYKIQEVIKRRQVMLVQVVKEERGNKGAALTTYLSLAGRYAVLMPNTARGGGISRKITSAQDRSRLKEVVQDLDVPEGMGIILRTAGASRTKPEIKRDFEYLIRMWETVRDMTLRSQAPTLVYEEGSLIKRSLRDLYNKEIDEIQVAGEAGYQEARDFMQMLMPSNTRAVKLYRDGQPLFSRMGVESQLDAMFSPIVQLRSGGYIVINQTEALVSIDVNSGRSTREHHIEDTALKTNLEASEEVARQLRLRDLAGLIVIDFIDMDEKRNNRAVERKLSDCLRQDRARIQVGRISHFGLLEMSRQRIRASVLESSTEVCPHCGGNGHVRSVSSVALQLLRGLEEALMKGPTHNMIVRTRTDVALYVLNHKRGHLRDLEESFKVSLAVIADPNVTGQQSFVIDRGEQVHTLEAAKALLAAQVAAFPPPLEEPYDDEDAFDVEAEIETEETEGLTGDDNNADASGETDGDGPKRKRRRRRRGRSGDRDGAPASLQDEEGNATPQDAVSAEGTETTADDSEGDEDDSDDQSAEARADQADGERRPRRRGRRGGRRRRSGSEDGLVGSIADELSPAADFESTEAVADLDGITSAKPLAAMPIESGSLNEDHAEAHAAVSFAEPQDSTDVATQAAPPAAAGTPAMIEAEHAATQAEAPAKQTEAAAPQEEPAPEAEKTPRRRSTVREKVSFTTEPIDAAESQAEPTPTVAPEPAPVAASAQDVAPAASAETAPQPRRAGWWSRRFGGGE